MAAKKSILVIDDEADSRAYTEAVISESGDFEVLSAVGGEEGYRIAHEKVPDLIILDMVMPGLNGAAVFKRLLEDEITKAIPVIFLTGIAQVTGLPLTIEAIEKNLGKAPHAVLEKPINPPQLSGSIKSALSDTA